MSTQSYIERLYYRDIGRYNVLTEPEERRLVLAVQAGNRKAVNDLIIGNLRFVVSIARKYQNRGLSLLELINEGNLGMFKAAKRFNVNREVKFTSYAVWWVRQSIQKALFDQAGTVKIPPNKLTLIKKFKRALEKNDGDFYKTLAMSPFKSYDNEIIEILEKMTPYSLDAPIQDDKGDNSVHTLMDIIGVDAKQEDEIERKELKTVLNGILANMTRREETVLRMYYSIDYDKEFTLEEIGVKLKLTLERVRQIKNKALRKLFRNKDLRSHLKIVQSETPPYENG
jgi:RNA polymerase primary sigma factor